MDFEAASDYALKRLKNEASKNYYYHNLEHTVDVCQAVESLARTENVNKKDFLLLKTAAIFHDLGMVEEYYLHEEVSVRILRRVLPGFGYGEKEIDKISRLIYVTQFIEKPRTILEKIICDADLDYLGRPDYFDISHRLRVEWEALDLRRFSEPEWILYQLEFMQYHTYYTKAACKLRNKGKEQNIGQLKKLI